MSTAQIADLIGPNLPYLRRYARALTGSQNRGDAIAAATLELILEEPASFDTEADPRAALYKLFHGLWIATRAGGLEGETEAEKRALSYLANLTADTREALLLHTIEDFAIDQVAYILDVPTAEAAELVDIAYSEMQKVTTGKVLIIEDEAVIYLDLEEIVTEMGHTVTGIAKTETAAVDLARAERPDMILSDIQLADNSSGLDAVNQITEMYPETPVVVVTAYPERYLTGNTREPAFLITKPYEEHQIRSAVSQALFFSSIEVLQQA